MLRLRPYHPSDAPYLMDICLKTANNGEDATPLLSDPHLIGLLYVAPYLHYHPDLCFVVEKNHRVVGYVLATDDSVAFEAKCRDEFFAPLRARIEEPKGELTSLQQRVDARVYKGHPVIEPLLDYPAHLHIDLLPEAQGQGAGKALMHALFTRLMEKNIAGVHLIVNEDNLGAQRFYEALGMERQGPMASGIAFTQAFSA